MKAKKWARLAIVLTPLTLIGVALYGCSSDRPAAGGTSESVPDPNERCGIEGATGPCHEIVGYQGGARVCTHGLRVCAAGRWSACGAVGETTVEATNVAMGLENMAPPPDVSQLKAMAFGTSDAAGCQNPCDPGCLGFDLDAGMLSNDSSPDVLGIRPLESTPPGFVNKLLNYGGSPLHCEWYGSPAAFTSQNGWAASACQADFFCKKHCLAPGGCPGGQDGLCVKFREDGVQTHATERLTGNAVSCANLQPDLTIASPCELLGKTTVAICNRGSAPVAAGQTITMSVESPGGTIPYINTNVVNPMMMNTMVGCRTATSDCQTTLTAPLNPGACIRLIEGVHCGSTSFNGNKLAYVNSNASIQECALRTHLNDGTTPIAEHGTTGTSFTPNAAGEAPLQQGCGNNFSAWNNSSLPACPLPFIQNVATYAYSAECSAGQRPQWSKLGWRSSIPLLTDITFEVRVRDGATNPWTAWTTVGRARSGQDPANCTMTGAPNAVVGSGFCPKDLFTFLGGIPQARFPDLELRVTLNPTPAAAPILYDHFLAYTCVAAE